MGDINNVEVMENYFKQVNCFGKYNYFFVCNTIQNYLFGALGVLISIKKNHNVMGYLLNKNDKGICLIPIVTDTLTKNKLDIDNYIFINEDDISQVVIKTKEIGFKTIKIVLKDNTKYVLETPKMVLKREYHKINLDKFIEIYK